MRRPVLLAISALLLLVGVALWLALHDDAAPAPATAEAAPPQRPPWLEALSRLPQRPPVTEEHLVAPHAAEPEKPAAGMARIDGVVVDARGRAVQSFHLVAISGEADDGPDDGFPRWRGRPSMTRRDVADSAGHFSLDVAPGQALLRVVAPHFRQATANVTVTEGAMSTVRVVLEDSNALYGTVTDAATGAPIAGAHVRVWRAGETFSDDHGRFALLTLPDARFSVRVSADGYRSLEVGGIRGDHSRDEEIDVKLDAATADGPREEFVGTGFRLGRDDEHGTFYVGGVYPDTPAAAVLHEGDVITAVEGTELDGMTVEQVRQLILGDPGTSVRLDVLRGGKPLQFDIERARIALPSRRPRG